MIIRNCEITPRRGKSSNMKMLLPLQGEIVNFYIHRAMPYAKGLLGFQPAYLANADNYFKIPVMNGREYFTK